MSYRQRLMILHGVLWAVCTALFGIGFGLLNGMPFVLMVVLGVALIGVVVFMELRYQTEGKRWFQEHGDLDGGDGDPETPLGPNTPDFGNLIFRTVLTMQEVRSAKYLLGLSDLDATYKLVYLIGVIALGVVTALLWESTVRLARTKQAAPPEVSLEPIEANEHQNGGEL